MDFAFRLKMANSTRASERKFKFRTTTFSEKLQLRENDGKGSKLSASAATEKVDTGR